MDRNSKYIAQIEKQLNSIHNATKEDVYDYEEFKDIMGDIMLRSALALTYLEPMLENKKTVDDIETEEDDLEFLDSLCEDGLMP